jgi:hypothetical protein
LLEVAEVVPKLVAQQVVDLVEQVGVALEVCLLVLMEQQEQPTQGVVVEELDKTQTVELAAQE